MWGFHGCFAIWRGTVGGVLGSRVEVTLLYDVRDALPAV